MLNLDVICTNYLQFEQLHMLSMLYLQSGLHVLHLLCKKAKMVQPMIDTAFNK